MIPSCAWSRIVSKYRTDNGSNAGLVFFSFVFFQKGSKIDSKRSAARSAALYRAVELWERWSKAKAIKQATTSAGRRRPGADASGFVWRRRRSRGGGGLEKIWKIEYRQKKERNTRKTGNRKPWLCISLSGSLSSCFFQRLRTWKWSQAVKIHQNVDTLKSLPSCTDFNLMDQLSLRQVVCANGNTRNARFPK